MKTIYTLVLIAIFIFILAGFKHQQNQINELSYKTASMSEKCLMLGGSYTKEGYDYSSFVIKHKKDGSIYYETNADIIPEKCIVTNDGSTRYEMYRKDSGWYFTTQISSTINITNVDKLKLIEQFYKN